VLPLLAAFACSQPEVHGVYRSGANAIVNGKIEGTFRLWGPEGVVDRVASAGPGRTTYLGEAGPLWLIGPVEAAASWPAPGRAATLDAALVESAGWKLGERLGAIPTGAPDPARANGMYVRSMSKVARKNQPPIYVVAATRDTVGAGRRGGPEAPRSGDDCKAYAATVDNRATVIKALVDLADATAMCVPPRAVTAIDKEGDGGSDLLIHGQAGADGFRTWISVGNDGAIQLGASERWKGIP
jgi:hypothetical protein